jgi:hypothetical protein
LGQDASSAAAILSTSATRGDGVAAWYAWLRGLAAAGLPA